MTILFGDDAPALGFGELMMNSRKLEKQSVWAALNLARIVISSARARDTIGGVWMLESGGYGDGFGKRLGALSTSYVSRTLRKSTVAVTELRYDKPSFELSIPPREEDAFMVGHYVDCPKYLYSEEGKAAPSSAIGHGETIIYDVEQYFWLSDQNSPKHFCMTLQVSGETTVECWRETLDAIRLRHPLLQAMIARDEFGIPSFTSSRDAQFR